jgi:hypothetical protein
VFAASVDPPERARDYAAGLEWPTWVRIGHGATRTTAESIGAWWNEARGIVEPAEFILGADDKVIASSYSAGPLGRIEAADVIRMINFRESKK